MHKHEREALRELGFRITPRGIEHLEFGPDEDDITVRAVAPVVPVDVAHKLWEAFQKALKDSVLAKKEKDAWSHKAFLENEKSKKLEGELAALKAKKVKR